MMMDREVQASEQLWSQLGTHCGWAFQKRQKSHMIKGSHKWQLHSQWAWEPERGNAVWGQDHVMLFWRGRCRKRESEGGTNREGVEYGHWWTWESYLTYTLPSFFKAGDTGYSHAFHPTPLHGCPTNYFPVESVSLRQTASGHTPCWRRCWMMAVDDVETRSHTITKCDNIEIACKALGVNDRLFPELWALARHSNLTLTYILVETRDPIELHTWN